MGNTSSSASGFASAEEANDAFAGLKAGDTIPPEIVARLRATKKDGSTTLYDELNRFCLGKAIVVEGFPGVVRVNNTAYIRRRVNKFFTGDHMSPQGRAVMNRGVVTVCHAVLLEDATARHEMYAKIASGLPPVPSS